jgi:TolA-binding protein
MKSEPSASQYRERDFESLTPGPSIVQNWPTPPSNMQNRDTRSIGRRIFRTFARYSIVFLIGIGTTLAWQSYGDEAMEIVKTESPSLAWLLPVSTAKPQPDGRASVAAVVISAELDQQFRPMALDVASVRRSVEQLSATVEQLAAKQEQMVQNIATLQSVEQEISQKLSSPPQSRAAPPRKPPQPTGQ